jgi:thiamine biosynthesis lipoprotein
MVTLFNTYQFPKNRFDLGPFFRRWIGCASLCFAVICLSCCNQEDSQVKPNLTELSGSALGTTWSIKVLAHKEFDPEQLRREIVQKLEQAEKIFSHWRPDSELSLWNANKSTTPLQVNPQLYELVQHAQWMHHETGGAFDPTIAPLVNLWGFGPTSGTRSTIPKDEEIAEIKKLTGMENLEVLPKNRVRKKFSKLQLDFSGSAKGEIIDQVSLLLNRWTFKNYLVEIGGEVRAHGQGKKCHNGWIVGLESGEFDRDGLVSVALRDYAVATSGTYRLNKTNPKSPRNASHLLNPQTGKPVENNLIAVNAFAPTARDADAWATALMIMGLEKGLQKAEEMDLVARFCELKDGITNIYCSTAYHRLYLTEKNF